LAALAALATPAAPASALTVTIPPSLPAPLPPIQLPLGGSVSGGTGGAPIDVTVTGPGSTGIEATLPGVPNVPALPVGPTGSVLVPITNGDPVVGPAPASSPAPSPAFSSPRSGSDPAVTVPGDRAVIAQTPISRPAADSASAAPQSPAPPSSARAADVSAAIDARPADSLLQRVPAFASRLALWAALAAIVLVLQMLVGSAVRRSRSAQVS
jgi:hypothetical protein